MIPLADESGAIFQNSKWELIFFFLVILPGIHVVGLMRRLARATATTFLFATMGE
jgi:hypothetical protein